MELKVRFRFNAATGEVEIFEVDHEGDQTLSESEHNTIHDTVAAEIGRIVERAARVTEFDPAERPVPKPPVTEPHDQAGLSTDEKTDETEKQKGKH